MLPHLGLAEWAAEYERGALARAPLFQAAEEIAEIRERKEERQRLLERLMSGLIGEAAEGGEPEVAGTHDEWANW